MQKDHHIENPAVRHEHKLSLSEISERKMYSSSNFNAQDTRIFFLSPSDFEAKRRAVQNIR